MTSPPAPPCTLANLESRRFGDTWPIECAGVTLTLDQQVANFNNADLTGGHFEGFKLETYRINDALIHIMSSEV